jgi:hypothetical protein
MLFLLIPAHGITANADGHRSCFSHDGLLSVGWHTLGAKPPERSAGETRRCFFGNFSFGTAMEAIEVLSPRKRSGGIKRRRSSPKEQHPPNFPHKSANDPGEKTSIPGWRQINGPDCGSLFQVGNGWIVAVAILAKETFSSGQHNKINGDLNYQT